MVEEHDNEADELTDAGESEVDEVESYAHIADYIRKTELALLKSCALLSMLRSIFASAGSFTHSRIE